MSRDSKCSGLTLGRGMLLALIFGGIAFQDAWSNHPLSGLRKPSGASIFQESPEGPVPYWRSVASDVWLNRAYRKLPLSFEANRGQSDPRVRFLSRGRDSTLFLTPAEIVLALSNSRGHLGAMGKTPVRSREKSLRSIVVMSRIRLVHSNPKSEIIGTEPLPGKSNYFVGNDKGKWLTGIPNYGRVEYRHIYPGIDMVVYGKQWRLHLDFILAPDTDPQRITLAFEGTGKPSTDVEGNLNLLTGEWQIKQIKPFFYQQINGKRLEIPGHYVLKENGHIGLQAASFDRSKPLIIALTSAYFTCVNTEDLPVSVDVSGNAYVVENTPSTDFPSGGDSGTATPRQGLTDVSVKKLSADGSTLSYTTYFGGSGMDYASSMDVDGPGNIYVTGNTRSNNFPTTAGAFQASLRESRLGNAFVTKLNHNGSAIGYSTYLGGSEGDIGLGIKVDSSGNAHVSGITFSLNDFPANPAFVRAAFTEGVRPHTFITQLNPKGSGIIYSSHSDSFALVFSETTHPSCTAPKEER